MNPTYKLTLAANGGVEQQAFPVYRDELAKDFELQSNQQFYRVKLSSKLTFVADDYVYIMSYPIDTQFTVIIYISYDKGATWAQYWKGRFWKTDCEIDIDNKQAIVTPEVLDNYTAILDGQEREFDLIKLAPSIVNIKMDKRPLLQVYVAGSDSIACYLSGMWWEQDCEVVKPSDFEGDVPKLVGFLHFSYCGYYHVAKLLPESSLDVLPYCMSATNSEFPLNGENYYLGHRYVSGSGTHVYFIARTEDDVEMWRRVDSQYNVDFDKTFFPVSGTGANGNVRVIINTVRLYSRYICDVPKFLGFDNYKIPDNDMTDIRGYSYIVSADVWSKIFISRKFSDTQNEYGKYLDFYYAPPSDSDTYFPISKKTWDGFSLWFKYSADQFEDFLKKTFAQSNNYPISSVISKLLGEIAPGITHAGTEEYSEFLYGETNPITGIWQTIVITQKSNVVSAGYDQPAQKAPITLKQVLDMLRDCFRCYWFVDSQRRFRIEHIRYFKGGGSYEDEPEIGVDLTGEYVSRSGKEWAFGTSKFQYEKPSLVSRYEFGWMDDVTKLFMGYPINILSKFVNLSSVEQITVNRFSSDVDYIMLNPEKISKDGFVLFAAVLDDTVYNKYLDSSGNEVNNDSWNISPFIPVMGGDSIEWLTGAATSMGYLIEYSSNKQFLDYWTPNVGSSRTVQLSANAAFVRISYANYNYMAFANKNGAQIFSADEPRLKLPYLDIDENGIHYALQNGYVAFAFLQQYYAYDMPALHYEINGEQKTALGLKKIKTQTLKFPAFTDPNTLHLIKTNLGNGTIQKMSINLSSRIANTTLKYDTE